MLSASGESICTLDGVLEKASITAASKLHSSLATCSMLMHDQEAAEEELRLPRVGHSLEGSTQLLLWRQTRPRLAGALRPHQLHDSVSASEVG
jgi:hypothetical protein